VTFASVDLSLGDVVLHNVQIDRGWIRVVVDEAHFDRKSEIIHLMRGQVFADIDKKPTGTGVNGSAAKVTADDLTITLSRGFERIAVLQDVRVTTEKVFSEVVDAEYRGYKAHLTKLESSRDLSFLKADRAEFPEGLRLKDYVIYPVVNGVSLDVRLRSVWIDHANIDFPEDPKKAAHILAGQIDLTLEDNQVHVAVGDVWVTHPWVGTNVKFRHVDFKVGSSFEKGALDLSLGPILDGSPATLHLDLPMKSISGNELCQTWVDALPRGDYDSPLPFVKLAGNIQFSIGLLPELHFNVSGQCRSTCNEEILTALRHRFLYRTYDNRGEPNKDFRSTGPSTSEWVPLSNVNEMMLLAASNMEDPGFLSHHGYSSLALQNSFLHYVKLGKFQRGGSTITMQLAKNLWLARDKTLLRKIHELFLSQVLESCFSKTEIMELYLNVIEFGPNLYGLRQAAKHYFHVDPSQLTAQQAFYLAWILPRPRSAPLPDESTMKRMDSLMRSLVKSGRLSDTVLLSVDSADASGWSQ